jgi:hypothetical protein
MTELDVTIQKWIAVRKQMEELELLERGLRDVIASSATFAPGSGTGHLVAAGVKIKVVRRENVSWKQDRLAEVAKRFGEKFASCFKSEWKPDTRAVNAVADSDPEFAKAINWAREIRPGTPQVSYEVVDE